jgi:transcriptional regulator with XRE-family HTH domain
MKASCASARIGWGWRHLQYDGGYAKCMTMDVKAKDIHMTISAAQCRAARGLLDWTQDQIAENAQVARATIADFERHNRLPMRNNMVSIVSALEAAGVAFIPENGEGAGVRFRKVELEYLKNLRESGSDLILSVKHRGRSYAVVIPREILDDIDRTNYGTARERMQSVQKHFPLFLRVTEEAILAGRASDRGEITLTSDMFPAGVL